MDEWNSHRSRPLKNRKKSRTRSAFISHVTRWLRKLGYLAYPAEQVTPFSKKILQFIEYMRHEQGLAERTIKLRTWLLKDFFSNILKLKITSLFDLEIRTIDMLLIKRYRTSNYARSTIRYYISSIRTFLKYAETRNWCKKGLAELIRTPKVYRLASLPSGPSWDDIGRLIASAKGSNPVQIRDRAILMILAIYGLRSSEISKLRLDDFDWKNNILHIWKAKGERAQKFPLSKIVGKAVAKYIKKARPDCLFKEVFITTNAPYRPVTSAVVYYIVSHRLKSLNIELNHYGPHSIRHACASRLINTGISIEVISNHLGHKNIDSTLIYTKVDLIGLRKVAEFNIEDVL